MSSRKEQKEALRAERERRAQEAAAADRRKRMVGYGVAGAFVVAVVAAVVALVLFGGGESGESAAEPEAAAFPAGPALPPVREPDFDAAVREAGCTYEQFPSEGQEHVSERVEYKTNPPTSGNHNEFPAEDGAYLEAPEMEHLVHSLEHGRVIFWYQPEAADALKGQLKRLFDEDSYHVLLAPNTRDMPAQVGASSWTRSLTCPEVNDRTWDALRAFRDRYRDQAPERVP